MSILKNILPALVPALLFSSCDVKKEETTDNPNVIIILTDDQGWGDLGFTGNTNLKTPVLDSLAESGAFFNNFYVSPLCAPTRAEMLTGRYNFRSGVTGVSEGLERINMDEVLMSEVFKNAGYATAAYGKWHNGMQAPYHPNSRGFDDFYGFCSGHWGNYFSPMLERNGDIVKGEGYIVDDITEKGMEFIENNKDQPFFLYLPIPTPHSPMQVPDRWWDKFADMDLNLRNQNPEREDILHTKAALAMCENIDWNVGRILKKLQQLELEENTIIVFFSDNGPNGWRWNAGMKGKKGSIDEGGIRSPLVISWKNQIQGKFIESIASTPDLLPTLLDLTGIESEPVKPFDGESLKPLLVQSSTDWDERTIVNQWRDQTSVRNQRFRLDPYNQLFDLENDRGQTENVATNFPEVYDELMSVKKEMENKVDSARQQREPRPFILGHPSMEITHVPARDGVPHGNITRSNRYPNCSFFTNWTSGSDSITWDVNVWESATFEVELYYTLEKESEGITVELVAGKNALSYPVNESHDPPLKGMENDRVKRIESYVKDFIPLSMGRISLEKGKTTLILKSPDKLVDHDGPDVRLLLFKKVEESN